MGILAILAAYNTQLALPYAQDKIVVIKGVEYLRNRAEYPAEILQGLLTAFSYCCFAFYMLLSAVGIGYRICSIVLLSLTVSNLTDEITGKQYIIDSVEYFLGFITIYLSYYAYKNRNNAAPDITDPEQMP